MNDSHRPSEEEALDRAITSIDPMLRASLQRDQNQRRKRVVLAGGILMATMAVVLLSVVIFASGFLGLADAGSPKDKIDQAAQAAELSATGWKLWQAQKPDEAEAKFAKAVQLDPKAENAWNGLGWTQFNQGKYTKAVEAFEKCVEINPKHPAALNGLGQACLLNRDYAKHT